MPEIKFKHLVSCSSEDKVHKAENLLKPELYRKWKCASPGEKRASVILQLEKATEIHAIDIGNEGSAFVEVLVGKSSDPTNDYQVLLVASSFMSPLESRNELKTNRVRMFGSDKLAQNLKSEKWDCVQIVCTQPFSKNIQYGLSFIKFHSPPTPVEELVSENKAEQRESAVKLGSFEIKDVDDDEEESKLSVGHWFQKRNETSSSQPNRESLSSLASATLSQAANTTSKIISKVQSQESGMKRKFEGAADTSSNVKVQRTVAPIKPKVISKPNSETKEQKPLSHVKTTSGNVLSDKKQKKDKPFYEIMGKVVFALSGFQNPFRNELRVKAVDMGAKYKMDWDDSCTHLVCAFVNTPKYNKVLKEKGRIVKKEWLIDCHKKKKLLPWRAYMLGKYYLETSDEDSEEEEDDVQLNKKEETKPKDTATALSNKEADTKSTEQVHKIKSIEIPGSSQANGVQKKSISDVKPAVSGSEEEDFQADTDVDSSSSGGDTEDEIRKVEQKQAKRSEKKKEISKSPKKNGKGKLSGEDESDALELNRDDNSMVKVSTKDLPLPELPGFLKGKRFFFYGSFTGEERHKLRRYIVGFNGSVEEYMGDNVKFVITNEKWDKNFDEALSENENLTFVRPQWIFKCAQNDRFVPYQPYIVVPDT